MILMFSRGSMNIQDILKISPQLRAVLLVPRYQEINSSIKFSVLFYQIGMARAGLFWFYPATSAFMRFQKLG